MIILYGHDRNVGDYIIYYSEHFAATIITTTTTIAIVDELYREREREKFSSISLGIYLLIRSSF